MTRFISFIFLLTVTTAFGQSSNTSLTGKNIILWNEFYKLQWNDFQGEPQENSIGDAGAVVQIKAKPYKVKSRIFYTVEAVFNRKKSWARDQSQALLAHEQLHFDIAELYARKIRQKIKELSDRGVDDVKTFNAAIQQLLDESNEIDRQYDIETLHGAISKRQAAWTDKVKQGLRDLENYRKAKRIVKSG
jgi:predicted secreted Zn-dependent protease